MVSRKPQVIFPHTGIRLHDIHVVHRLSDHSDTNSVSWSRDWQHQSMTPTNHHSRPSVSSQVIRKTGNDFFLANKASYSAGC